MSKAPGMFAILARRFLTTTLCISLLSLSLYIYIHLAALGQLAFYKSTIASGGATILLTFIQLNTIVTRYATRVNKNARGIDVHWLFHPSVRSGG